MPFQREKHRKIVRILNSFNSSLLEETRTYFGGGTLISLWWGEYRQSNDIDFLCSLASSGYRSLRQAIFDNGYQALFHHLDFISIQRGTTDQYGIRLLIKIEEISIKTEIIAESRFQLDAPIYHEWSMIPCLSLNDCFTSKLLANSDRYMDDGVESRDLIDLAVLRLQSAIPLSAIDKAEQAYEVIRPLRAALKQFQSRPEYREKCLINLQVSVQQFPTIIDGIDLLATDMGLETTERTFKEQRDLCANID